MAAIAKRKKRGKRLMIAYILRGAIFAILVLMIVLMMCGVLYIKEHLAPTPDSEPSAENTEIVNPDLSGLPIVPVAPSVPREVIIYPADR